MLMEHVNSDVFGGPDVVIEATLKNPNQFKEAVLFESLSTLPTAKLQEFVRSNEAKTMLEAEIISQDMIDRLVDHSDNGCLQTTVCHMAKEEDDPLWNELVRCRVQERRLMNELLAKYGEVAQPIADDAQKELVEAFIPEYFRH